MTQRTGSQRPSVNFLQSASNVVILGGSFAGVQQYETKEFFGQNSPLKRFYARVAPNAILNTGGRADHARCHPGTRDEVIGAIEKWIDGDGDLSRSIFWLSGPAGAGKTAIIQTIAERCIQRKVAMANYFFFRADTTRNHAGSVVATLLYQIVQLYPELKTNTATLLDAKPLVFDQSIEDQFKDLIDNPVRTVVDTCAHTPRLVLLIDGLDECSPETKHVQRDLLHALHHLSSQQDSPFVVLVASRAEPHLVMTFNEIGPSENSIFLNEDYHPSDDICLFVAAEFNKVKRTHHLGQALGNNWPSKEDINDIVDKSSGQFIYAATVMRFISSSSASPEHSLERVRGIRPIVKNSPFAELDAIYTHILSQAEDWDSAKMILAGQLILLQFARLLKYEGPASTIPTLLSPLRVTNSDIESYLADLVSVVRYDRATEGVVFYHASLREFLCDESRSNALYIDLKYFVAKLASEHILHMSSFNDAEQFCYIFTLVETRGPPLTDALISWKPWKPDNLHSRDQYQKKIQLISYKCLANLSNLYYKDDNSFYKSILRKWLTWLADLGISLETDGFNRDIPQASEFWDDILRSRSGGKSLTLEHGEELFTRNSEEALTQSSKVAFWKRLLLRHSGKQ